jgi:hypothetical protein
MFIGNIFGYEFAEGILAGGEEVFPWITPEYPFDTDDFPYVFLVFEQPREIDWTDVQ